MSCSVLSSESCVCPPSAADSGLEVTGSAHFSMALNASPPVCDEYMADGARILSFCCLRRGKLGRLI